LARRAEDAFAEVRDRRNGRERVADPAALPDGARDRVDEAVEPEQHGTLAEAGAAGAELFERAGAEHEKLDLSEQEETEATEKRRAGRAAFSSVHFVSAGKRNLVFPLKRRRKSPSLRALARTKKAGVPGAEGAHSFVARGCAFPMSLLPPFLATTSILDVFDRCDTVDKVIVTGLAIFSLIAWTIMLGKHFELKRLRLLNLTFEARLRDQRTLLDAPESFRTNRPIPYGDLFADAVDAYGRAAAIGRERGQENSRARLEHAENAIQRALARQTLRYETSMIFLA